MNEERLVRIETQLAFQEQTIKDLNDVLYAQQQEIDRLGKKIEELLESLPAMDVAAPSRPNSNSRATARSSMCLAHVIVVPGRAGRFIPLPRPV